MSSTLPSIEAALYSTLGQNASVASTIGGTAAPRLYNLMAPSGAARPHIIFYLGSGLVSNTSPRDDVNDVFRVEAVAETRGGAETLSGAIYTALHGQELTITGWSNYLLQAERKTTIVENSDGRQYWRYIVDYRIRADKS